MSTLTRNLTLKAHFGASKHADALSTLYVALVQGNPKTGTYTEPDTTGGYARVAVTNDATLWGAIGTTDVQVFSITDIVWPSATALWSLSVVDHWVIFDASSGGDIRYSGALTNNISPTGVGDVPRIPSGQFSITVDE